ncbi:MFS transporter [Cohnella suwonensis]|uniref:MFS transporter n=1 Tax=Cohnella suwonensis TaxID=696072 RepID=A0ABW0LZZ1_9BACL
MRWFRQARTDVQGWSRGVRMFFLANVLYQIGNGMFTVLYNLYVDSLGFGQNTIGSIVSVQSLAAALMIIPIGLLGDRSSRKTILVAGMLLTGFAYVGSSFAETGLALRGFAIMSGLFTAFFQVTAVPFLASNSDKHQRLRMFSFHFSVMLASQVVGSLAGGFLGDLLQAIGWSETASLRSALSLGGLLSITACVPLLFVKERTHGGGSASKAVLAPEDAAISEESADADGHRREWRLIARLTFAQLLIGFGSGMVVPYLNVYFTDRFDVSLSAIGLLISLGQMMTVLSMLIGPSLVGKVGQVRSVVIFQLLSLPFLLLTGFTNVLFVAGVAFLFRQALMNAANPIQSSILVDRISDSRRGVANSLTQTVFMLGWASMGQVQPHLISRYGAYWGYVLTFSITGALYVTSAIYFYFVMKDSKNRQG